MYNRVKILCSPSWISFYMYWVNRHVFCFKRPRQSFSSCHFSVVMSNWQGLPNRHGVMVCTLQLYTWKADDQSGRKTIAVCFKSLQGVIHSDAARWKVMDNMFSRHEDCHTLEIHLGKENTRLRWNPKNNLSIVKCYILSYKATLLSDGSRKRSSCLAGIGI